MFRNRKQFIVNSGMQIKFTLIFVCVSLAGCFLSIAFFNYLAMEELESLMWSTHLSIGSTSDIIRPFFLVVNLANFIFVAVLLSLTGYWMLRKTTGPLVKISKDIREITEGDYSKSVNLRHKDEFIDVADELDKMVKATRDRFASIKARYADINAQIVILQENAGPDVIDALRGKISALRQELGKLQ